ncbi:hypothetical protein [Brevibacillus massiliensis]|jgi:cbb3-type cytochrome oxidase subunit 1|uniref:hypothetical protein n=1 Tax=Brevibacillus massiliensis TaxID=1118054 RepID=UPI0002EC8671|nr:hypothetical protein [Brevibacillus massiliensis]
MGARLLKISVVYFVIGVLLGMYMSMSQMFTQIGVHAHINLLGWVSLALAGLIYHLFPQAAESRLGVWHFWLHNIGLPVMMIGLFFFMQGHKAMEAAIIIGSIVTIIGIILFAVNVWRNVR